jgi:putative hydrolases of HD superfamily
MYRMAVLALCSEDPNLDISKYGQGTWIQYHARLSIPNRCVMLAVVHDLAEAQVGDITPDEGFSDAQKRQLEEVL